MRIVNLEARVSDFDGIIPAGTFDFAGTYQSYENTRPEEVVSRAADAEILLINKTKIGENELQALPRLRYVGVLATGYNVVDLAAARKHGITVTNVPAYSTDSVVQLVFAHLFNLCRAVEYHAQADWSEFSDFSVCLTPQIELNSLTMGILGFGAIGRAVALSARTFGMNVITTTRTPSRVDLDFVKTVPLETLFRESDVLTLHAPMTPETDRIVNRKTLALMKKSAFLINTARGGLVDEEALAEALDQDRIAGAGLDVLSVEPPPHDHRLLHRKNCRITPHIAWGTLAARRRLCLCAVENVRAFLAGKAQNVVS